MSELSVLDLSGDTRLQWNSKNAEEVAQARKKFDEFRTNGYAAYKATKAGSELIHNFEPDAERVILRPPMIGG
jgi:hypothetical protein